MIAAPASKGPRLFTASASLRQETHRRAKARGWRADCARAVAELLGTIADASYRASGFQESVQLGLAQISALIHGPEQASELAEHGVRQVRRTIQRAEVLGLLSTRSTRPLTLALTPEALDLLGSKRAAFGIPKRTKCPVTSGQIVRLDEPSHIYAPEVTPTLPTGEGAGAPEPTGSNPDKEPDATDPAKSPDPDQLGLFPCSAPDTSDPNDAPPAPVEDDLNINQAAAALRKAFAREVPEKSTKLPLGLCPRACNGLMGKLRARIEAHPHGIRAALDEELARFVGLRPKAEKAMEVRSLNGWMIARLGFSKASSETPEPVPDNATDAERAFALYLKPRGIFPEHKEKLLPKLDAALLKLASARVQYEGFESTHTAFALLVRAIDDAWKQSQDIARAQGYTPGGTFRTTLDGSRFDSHVANAAELVGTEYDAAKSRAYRERAAAECAA